MLNASEGVTLWNKDFSDIKIPQADLSGAILWSSDFSGADLTEVNLQACHMREVNLSHSKMMKVRFGEWPWIATKRGNYAFSLNGKLVAVATDETIELYDIESRHYKKYIRVSVNQSSNKIRSIAFDKRGEQLASGSEHGIIYLWDVNMCQELKRFIGHKEGVCASSCVLAVYFQFSVYSF